MASTENRGMGPAGSVPMDSTMIGALVIHARNGSIKQIDKSLCDALKGEPRAPVHKSVLLARLRQNGYPNVHLEFPWEKETP